MSPLAYVVARPLPLGWTVPQREGIAWMKAALSRSGVSGPEASRALRLYDLLARQSSVESRVTALEDYSHQDWDRMDLFVSPASGDGQTGPPRPWQHPTLQERMRVFADTALSVARETFGGDTEAPDLLVQVSCTGYDSPTVAQRVALENGWTETRLLHIGHMGCYAALPALATAADVVRSRAGVLTDGITEAGATAAILLLEMCTLHHRVEATDIEIVVQQCLFADGAARLDVTSERPSGRSLALLDHHEALVPDTLGEMTWGLADGAFAMTLSRRVPDHIRAGVEGVVSRFLARHGLSIGDVDLAAIHPGGPRVIEATAEALGFSDEQTRHSRAVLAARGNMSSTTLPHIWARLTNDATVPDGSLVLSLAFGPGLTIAANLLRVEG